ncbi:MAG: hypothetical protein HKP58_05115, partial [Desulfatitalea sp.]|nr:hypothetical protein [Desulfatitalea sp.]NNJ99773.1 hypothetical protein [Desulfatitalea sp.]
MTMQVTRAIVILVGVLFLIGAAGAEPGCCADWHDPQSDVPEAAGALASSEMSGMPLVRIWPTIA